MATLKEHCPNCGGAIILFEGAITGTCDSCGTTYSLSDLQKIKEFALATQTNPNENYRDLSENEHYETALDINEADEFSLDVLCKKAETALESEQWQIACRFSDEILRRNPKFAKAYLYRLLAEYKVYKKEALANLEQPFDSNDNCRLLMRFADPYLKLEIETYCKAASDKYHAKTLEDRYQALCKRLPAATTEKHYQDLANGFHSLDNYKESQKLLSECLNKAQETAKRERAKQKAKQICAVLVIFVVVFSIVGAIISKRASYRLELFSIEVTDKINFDYDDQTVSFVLKFNIHNNSKHNANYLEGYITIRDTEGNVLAHGPTWFRGAIASQNANYFELSLDLGRDASGIQIWNTDFSKLIITYRITKIHFDDRTKKEYNGKDVVVNNKTS